jgi:hypothetical protein
LPDVLLRHSEPPSRAAGAYAFGWVREPYYRRVLYLVGGSARSGKSALGLTLLRERGVPWLSTDIVRTVLRDADPRIEEADAKPPDLERLAGAMRPFIERTRSGLGGPSPQSVLAQADALELLLAAR